MNRIDRAFSDLRSRGRKALVAYMTAGFPSRAGADRAFRDLARAGADVVEIGVPFSDPIADGPTIQYASQKSLEGGTTLAGVLGWVGRLRKSFDTPLVLMSYLNPVLRMGAAAFARRAAAAGVDGLIVPDLIPEEAGGLAATLAGRGIHLIFLVAPTTPPARRRAVARRTRGFLYAVSLTGVTGARRDLPAGAPAFFEALKRESPAPVVAGFGISTADHARRLAPHVDGIVVGSAIIDRLRRGKPIYPFARALRSALDDSRRRTHVR